ncbi:MAG: hypothetical protein M3X11_02160 [Acidobacteriota bacterium]|nr:hypothetical protein [Acidobacteriota bacterium]
MAPSFQLPPQTLHLDNQRAWRQGEDAVFLPIVYDLPEYTLRHPETVIVQAIATDLPADFLGREEKRRNFASLKRKADTGDFHLPQATQQNQPEIDPIFDNPGPPKSKRLFKSVLTLLLSVIALVFFAWIAFR